MSDNTFAYLAVACSWVAGIVCGTYLIVNNHPWLGVFVLLIGCVASVTDRKGGGDGR